MLEMAVDVRDGYVNVLGHFIAIAMWNTIGSTLPAKHDGTFRDRELRMANNSVAFSPKMFREPERLAEPLDGSTDILVD